MGYRINRRLGFGFADVKVDRKTATIRDPRFNSEFDEKKLWKPISNYADYLTEEFGEEPSFGDSGDLLSVLDAPLSLAFMDKVFISNNPKRLSDSFNKVCLLMTGEEDLMGASEGIILFQPLSDYKEWSRNDDAIDYAEATEMTLRGDDAMSVQVNPLTLAPYPYDGSYISLKDYTKVDSQSWNLIRNFLQREETPLEERYKVANAVSEKLGFKNYQEAKKFVTPRVPDEVRNITKYLNIFNDESTYLHLKPMVVTYWA